MTNMTEHFYPQWRTYACDAYNVMTNMTTYRSTGGPSAVSATTNTHHRFVYDGYLCIQRLNAAANNAIDLVFGWDPSEPVATRPLVLQKYGEYNLFYTHDGNKNVSELVFFQQTDGIAAHYEYAPFGAVAVASNINIGTTDFVTLNPLRYSCEFYDVITDTIYYNYRNYAPLYGRWLLRDPVEDLVVINEQISNLDESYIDKNLYVMINNEALQFYDVLGLVCGSSWHDWFVPDAPGGFDFTSACENHDRCYGKCGSVKSDCDAKFKSDMLKVCSLQPKTKDSVCLKRIRRGRRTRFVRHKCKRHPRKNCEFWASTYYNAVKYLGQIPFYMAQRSCQDCEEGVECNEAK